MGHISILGQITAAFREYIFVRLFMYTGDYTMHTNFPSHQLNKWWSLLKIHNVAIKLWCHLVFHGRPLAGLLMSRHPNLFTYSGGCLSLPWASALDIMDVSVAQPKTCHHRAGEGVCRALEWGNGHPWPSVPPKTAPWAYSGTGGGTPPGHTQFLRPRNLWYISAWGPDSSIGKIVERKPLSPAVLKSLYQTLLNLCGRTIP